MEKPAARDSTYWFVGLSVALLLVVWLGWWQWDVIAGLWFEGPAEEIGRIEPVETGFLAAQVEGALGPSGQAIAERQWTEQLGQPPRWPEDLVDPQDCEEVEADLARVCAVLDQRDYVRAVAPPGGACGLLRTVAEELAVRPPDITSELKSYPIMLENVFYLFRVLGRERLALVRRIQWEEQTLAEPAAMAIYRWMATRESCSRSGRTTMTTEALYDYGGFFFGTMGGQAYLRRRTPKIEALASFYGLLFLDRARLADHDPAGIDPRLEIQRTRELIAGQQLVFRDHYLLMLDRMAENWKRRSEPS